MKKNNQHFNPYFQDNTLLIQFIIAEFIATYHVFNRITFVEKQFLQSNETWKNCKPLLLHCFSQLLGPYSNPDWLGGSMWTKGHITKIKNYCLLLSKNMESNHSEEVILKDNIHQMWLSALLHVELLIEIQDSVSRQKVMEAHQKIRRALNHLQKRLNSMAKQILRVTSTFSDNENVVFFLIRKKEQLVEIYGENYMEKILKFSTKKTGSFRYLMKKYVNRGFGHLLSNKP